jgi:yecA family protein
VIASAWVGGFLDAVALHPEAWKALMDDDDAGMLMVPLLLLNGDLEFDDSEHDEDEFLIEAPDMIPTCIAGIHRFWKSRSRMAAANVRRNRRRENNRRR